MVIGSDRPRIIEPLRLLVCDSYALIFTAYSRGGRFRIGRRRFNGLAQQLEGTVEIAQVPRQDALEAQRLRLSRRGATPWPGASRHCQNCPGCWSSAVRRTGRSRHNAGESLLDGFFGHRRDIDDSRPANGLEAIIASKVREPALWIATFPIA